MCFNNLDGNRLDVERLNVYVLSPAEDAAVQVGLWQGGKGISRRAGGIKMKREESANVKIVSGGQTGVGCGSFLGCLRHWY